MLLTLQSVDDDGTGGREGGRALHSGMLRRMTERMHRRNARARIPGCIMPIRADVTHLRFKPLGSAPLGRATPLDAWKQSP